MAEVFGPPNQTFNVNGDLFSTDDEGRVGDVDQDTAIGLCHQGCVVKEAVEAAVAVLGNPEGGNKGPYSINAAGGLYVDGVDVLAPDIEGYATTVNGTDAVVIAGMTPQPNTMNVLEITFAGRQDDSINGFLGREVAGFLCDATGRVSQLGTTTLEETQATAGATGWTVGISTDGTNIVLTATGGPEVVRWYAWGNVSTV